MNLVSPRVRHRIESDYPSPGSAEEVTRIVAGVDESERVQAAVVLIAGGDLGRLRQAVNLAATDWRDVLVGAGLADDDWRTRLDAALGPEV